MTRRLLALAATAMVGGLLAGCGHKQGAPVPAAQASDIITRLNEADRRAAHRYSCHDALNDSLPAIETQLQSLPQNVDSNVRATLNDGVAHLKDLITQACAAAPQTQTQTQSTPTQTQPTDTVPTQTVPTQPTTPTQTTPTHPTTPTQTTPTQTTPTQTTPTQTTPATNPSGGAVPPGKGNGNGNGNGNGGGQ